jgi:hypothetical protein
LLFSLCMPSPFCQKNNPLTIFHLFPAWLVQFGACTESSDQWNSWEYNGIQYKL